METAIFVGGPLHGQLRDVRPGEWTIEAAEPEPVAFDWDPYGPDCTLAYRNVTYTREKVVLFGRTMLVFAAGELRRSTRLGDALLGLILTPMAKGALR